MKLVCHHCHHQYPNDMVLNPKHAFCCDKPDLHVHDHPPCELCKEPELTLEELKHTLGTITGESY